MAFITVSSDRGTLRMDGVDFPTPSRDVQPTVFTVVDSSRNANAVTVGQRIGRDQYKIDSLKWKVLSAKQWSRLLTVISTFYFYITFTDPVTLNLITIKAYCGDRKAKPYWIDDNGSPTMYVECSVNFIDTGEE